MELDITIEDIPPGFRFAPTEEQLVGFFLLNKVMEPSWGYFDCFIEHKNIYDHAPWNIFTDNQDWSKLNRESAVNNKKTQFYAFTKLKKKGKNVIRSSGCGKWHGQTGPKPIKYYGEIMGWEKMFTFELMENTRVGEEHWIMHEYSLDKDYLKQMRLNVYSDYDNYVICHITKYESRRII